MEQLDFNLPFHCFVGTEIDVESLGVQQESRMAEGEPEQVAVEDPPDADPDKNYDTHDFVRQLRRTLITPRMAKKIRNRSSAIDRRTTRRASYALKVVEHTKAWDFEKQRGLLTCRHLQGIRS